MDVIDAFLNLGISGWLVTVLVFLLARWYMARSHWENQPPGPPSLPVLGSLLFIPDKDFRKGFMKMAQKYGPVFKVDVGSKSMVVLNGHDIMEEALLKIGPALSGRPYFDELDYRKEKGIAILSGEKWTEQRRFILHTLRNFGLGKNTLELIIQEELHQMSSELQKYKEPIDPYQLLQYTASNVFISFALGKRLAYDSAILKEFSYTVQRVCTLQDMSGLLHFFPMMQYLPGDIFKTKELLVLFLRLRDFAKIWVDEVKTNFDYSSEPKDFIEAYLLEAKKHEGNADSYFTEEMLLWHVIDLHGGSMDTTAATLTFGIIYMILNPDVQTKVHEEIDDIIGSAPLPSFRDKMHLPYCEAVISEIQRRADIVPLGIAHAPLEDIVLRGYHIPKGTHVQLNMHSINRDPEVWNDPLKFDPRRFLTDDGKYYNHPKFSPFGIGRRNCVGESLARRELFIMFVGLMQQFTFRCPAGAPMPDPEGDVGLIMHPKPFNTIIMQRVGQSN